MDSVIRRTIPVVGLVLIAASLATHPAVAQGLPEVTIEQPAEGIDVTTLGIPLTDIPLTINYSSTAGVDKIEVLVDGAVQFVDRFESAETEGRRAYLWDATAHGPGQHTISVIAFAGDRSSGAQTTIEYGAVPGPAEGSASPTLEFVSPGPGAVVTGLTTLQVEAEGANPSWVQFFLDGRAVGHSLTEPFSISIDSSLYADGRHVVYAAMKTDRGTLTSETLHVNFMNLDIPEPEGETVEEPASEAPGEEVTPPEGTVDEPTQPQGPAIAAPDTPAEGTTPPTPPPAEPVDGAVGPPGGADMAVVEPSEPAGPEVAPAPETAEPPAAEDAVASPGEPGEEGLALPGEWQPLGSSGGEPALPASDETGTDVHHPEPPEPVAADAPPVPDPPIPPATDAPTVRPLDMELAGPESASAPAPAPMTNEPPVVVEAPAEPVPDQVPAPEAPEQPELAPPAQVDAPPPLTPELVEIEGPQPDLAGPAMAGVAAPAAEDDGEQASAPGPVLIEQPQPADDEPVLAGPETAMPRPQTASQDASLAYLDGHALELTQPAHVENATVFVPIRDLVFAMGGSVEWDSVARKVTGRSAASTFAVSAESSVAMLDGEEVALEAPTRIVDDALMVPLGFALQALGVEGAYDASAGVLEFVSPTE